MGILPKMNAYETDMGQRLSPAGPRTGPDPGQGQGPGNGPDLVRPRDRAGPWPGTGPDPGPIFVASVDWSIELVFFQK